MLAISFNSVLIIAAIAVLVPVVLGLLPRVSVPGAVLEVIAGIGVGPSVLGWVRVDAPVQVLSDLGLGMLLFLAGLEIDVDRLRGPLARLAGSAFGVSVALALLCAYAFRLAGAGHPAAAAGDHAHVDVNRAAAAVAEGRGGGLHRVRPAGHDRGGARRRSCPSCCCRCSSRPTSKTTADQLVSLAIFLALLALIGLTLARVLRLEGLDRLLNRLEDRSAQIRRARRARRWRWLAACWPTGSASRRSSARSPPGCWCGWIELLAGTRRARSSRPRWRPSASASWSRSSSSPPASHFS